MATTWAQPDSADTVVKSRLLLWSGELSRVWLPVQQAMQEPLLLLLQLELMLALLLLLVHRRPGFANLAQLVVVRVSLFLCESRFANTPESSAAAFFQVRMMQSADEARQCAELTLERTWRFSLARSRTECARARTR